MIDKKLIKSFDTDRLMLKLWHSLKQDFCASLDSLDFGRNAEKHLMRGLITFRDYKFPARMNVTPYIFKCEYQLESLFKRYRFQHDKFNSTQLEMITNDSFEATQRRIASGPITRTEIVHRVIQKARSICRDVLGEFDEEEHLSFCRFGRRASVGNPASKSYLDLKLAGPISGSPEHIEWMKHIYLPTDDLLQSVFTEGSSEPLWKVCKVLSKTNVAKSYKALRGIMPNTLIGSFYTYGVGKMIEQRLKDRGLNIRKLQMQHRNWAQRYSKTRTHVTADLSAASDSFTSDLVNMLLPRKWFNKIRYGRISQYQDRDGSQKYMASFMTMGIGFTFPLQTLLFYSLLKAIQDLTETRGRISVYGDDLIYPSSMHAVVESVFPKLRLVLNLDKTYVHDSFRESCGGDYFRGVDVRPFQPQGQHQVLRRAPYLSLLYKIYNGLGLRWMPEEIPGTVQMLYREMLRVTNVLHQVPPNYPETSGIRVDKPKADWHIPWSPVVWGGRYQSLMFVHLREESDRRVVNSMTAYYWEKLRTTYSDSCEGFIPPFEAPLKWIGKLDKLTELRANQRYEASPEILLWKKIPKARRANNYRSKISGRRLVQRWATVALKDASRFVIGKASTSSWANATSVENL